MTVDRPAPLADPAEAHHLDAHGFVVLEGGLPRAGVDALAELYEGVIEVVGRDTSGSFRPSMLIDRPDLRAKLWDGVRAIVEPELGPRFVPGTTEVFGGSFVSKPSTPNSARLPHQDPTVFDEREHRSLSVWIPLVDSTLHNGTLHVLPGSHLMGNHVRPPDVESFEPDVADATLAEAEPLELEAGRLLVIDGEMIHHSHPNASGVERVATICAVRAAGASMLLVRSEGGAAAGTAELYEAPVEAYRSGDLVAPDLGAARLLRRAAYRPASLADLRASQARAAARAAS